MGTVYSDLKMFHYKEKLDSLPPGEAVTSPLHIRWNPTNRCNHRCNYCAYIKDLNIGRKMHTQDIISHEKMLEIAHDIVNMGVGAVSFSGGGEPLSHPHLLEACQILHSGGVKIACHTNGALLKGEIAEFFAHNATWIRLSMDGWDDESYTRYRQVKDGEYTRIMQNMKDFVALGGECVLGVSLIIDAENALFVFDSLRRLKEVGVNSVKTSVCIVSNDAAKNNAYHAPHFKLVQESIFNAKETLADETFEIMDSWHDMEERFEKEYNWCPFSQIVPVIGADLGVYTCHDMSYNELGLLGKLDNQSFMEFWMSGKEKFFRLDPSQHCTHHCAVNNKNRMLLDYLSADREHLAFV